MALKRESKNLMNEEEKGFLQQPGFVEFVSQTNEQLLFQCVRVPGKLGLCLEQLEQFLRVLPCGALKMALSCREGTATKGKNLGRKVLSSKNVCR